jgi:ATP-binding cassette subfamily C protein
MPQFRPGIFPRHRRVRAAGHFDPYNRRRGTTAVADATEAAGLAEEPGWSAVERPADEGSGPLDLAALASETDGGEPETLPALNEAAGALRRVFEQEGERLSIGSNAPLLLIDPATVWLVRSGQVNVFGVALQDGQPAGTRHFVLAAEQGSLLVGMERYAPAAPAAPAASSGPGAPDAAAAAVEPEEPPAPRDPLALIAAGFPGTEVLALPRARLADVGRLRDWAPYVATLVEQWVGRLEATRSPEIAAAAAGDDEDDAPRPSPRPAGATPVTLGQPVTLQPGACVYPASGCAWVALLEGPAPSLGGLPADFAPQQDLLPLTAASWLSAAPEVPATIHAMHTTRYLAIDPLWCGLQRYQQLVLAALDARLAATADAERARFQKRTSADRQALDLALTGLSSLDVQAAAPKAASEDRADVLLAACQLVGGAMAITVSPPKPSTGQTRLEPLQQIALASRVRVRPVSLSGTWWQADNGPLLAYREEGGLAVALLPTDAGGYDLVDPVSGEHTPVSEEVAQRLSPRAHTFYRSFPEKALALKEVLEFGLRGGRKDLVTVILCGLAAGTVAMATPLANVVLFNTVIPSANESQLMSLILGLAAVAIGGAAFDLTRAISLLRLEGRVDASVQAAVWDRLLSLPVPFFKKYSSGDLASRAMSITTIRQVLTGAGLTAVLSVVFSISSYLILFTLNPPMAWAVTGLLTLLVIVTTLANKALAKYQTQVTGAEGQNAGSVNQLINGIPKLRVAGVEHRAFTFWAKRFRVQNTAASMIKLQQLFLQAFNGAYPIVCSITIFWMLSSQTSNRMPTGSFLAFSAAMGQFMGAALGMSMAISTIIVVIPTYKRAKPILEALPEVDANKADPGVISGRCELDRVSFRYDEEGENILSDLSLKIAAGQFAAFVGPSGSGKSTILRLLLGFEKPTEGLVLYDGKELAMLDVRAVRQQIGVVLQNGKLLPGDIYTNIVGSSTLTLDDAWEAARLAGLDEDIERMPMGMHTYLSEAAGTLSGGQKQRLLIARAIVNRPKILLFDEATSALDNRSQALVSRSLEQLKATRIVIAHRLSTIIKADCIFVIVAGKVVQQGTYRELMNQDGPFVELVRRQLA